MQILMVDKLVLDLNTIPLSNYSILFFHFESAWEERNCVFLAILTIGRDMESANCIPGLAYMRWFVVEESLQYQVIQSRWIPFSGWQHNTFFACQLRHQLGCGMSHWWCVAIIKWKWQQEVEQFLFNRQEPDFEVDRATATDQPLDMWLYAASVDSSVSSPILQTNAASPKEGKMSTDTVHWTAEDTNHVEPTDVSSSEKVEDCP